MQVLLKKMQMEPSPIRWLIQGRKSGTLFLASLTLCACTTVQIATDKLAEKTLGVIGVKIENPNTPRPPKIVRIRLETAQDLNAGEDGKGLSTIFRLYKLKNQNAFITSPYSVFGNPGREKSAFGSDLVEVQEITLSPGELVEIEEKLSAESLYLGAVALYRVPNPQRWRFVFASSAAEKTGITIGLHTCAMTATTTAPVGMTLNESTLLHSTRCK